MDFTKDFTSVGLKLGERLGLDLGDTVRDSIELIQSSLYVGIVSHMMDELHAIQDDLVTYEHSIEVALLCMHFSRDMETLAGNSFDNEKLLVGALVHDIGKVQVPIEILNAERRLSDSEFAEMKNHVSYGVEIAEEYGLLDVLILDMIEYHHETENGSGYKGVYLQDFDPSVWLVNVADQLSAITQDRPYKEGRSKETALEWMDENGVSEDFLRMIS